MKGDFSRSTFDKTKHYSGVLTQQGRVQLDADANEQQAISQYRDVTDAGAVIGPGGTPRVAEGFKIGIKNNGSNLTISSGQYFVNGMLCENEKDGLLLTKQPDLPFKVGGGDFAGASLPTATGRYLVYLDVWQRHITCIDDPSVKESALGGPDTATRLKTVWQVRLLSVKDDATCADFKKDDWTQKWIKKSTGKLSARAAGGGQATKRCELPPTAGYRRLENQLYRVEIHKGGVRNQATFKWSRDNGSVETTVLKKSGNEITVQSTGLDSESLSFSDKDWAELIDDRMELNEPGSEGYRGQLVRINKVYRHTNKITLEPSALAHPDLDTNSHARLRRWDQSDEHAGLNPIAEGIPLSGEDIELEDGVVVKFEDGHYNAGDYWLIPARTAINDETGNIEWPQDKDDEPLAQPPQTSNRGFCPLALVDMAGEKFLPEPHSDCREVFPPLTDITADDVSFDKTTCKMPGAETVQDALDQLCGNARGCCTVTVSPNKANWEHVLTDIADGQDALICFPAGVYTLKEPLVLKKKGNLKLIGVGRGTRILAPKSETAIRFESCKSVTVRDLYASSGTPGLEKELRGTITAYQCPSVSLANLKLRCGRGTKRAATCVSVVESSGSVRIKECDLSMGSHQTGILLIDVARVHVEDNILKGRAGVIKRWLTDALRKKEFRASIRRGLIGRAYIGSIADKKKLRNANVVQGAYTVSFDTHPQLGKEWQHVLRDNSVRNLTTNLDLLRYMYRLADMMLMDTSLRSKYAPFVRWYAGLARSTDAADQGIVLGGTSSTDVRILNNSISGILQGIHVGLSHEAKVGKTANSAERVIISGNTVEVQLTPWAVHERHGIFVGNCKSLIIENNRVKIRSQKKPYIEIDGIRVYGHLGDLALVRQNHISRATTGIRVKPLNESTGNTWFVESNMAEPCKKRAVYPPGTEDKPIVQGRWNYGDENL